MTVSESKIEWMHQSFAKNGVLYVRLKIAPHLCKRWYFLFGSFVVIYWGLKESWFKVG